MLSINKCYICAHIKYAFVWLSVHPCHTQSHKLNSHHTLLVPWELFMSAHCQPKALPTTIWWQNYQHIHTWNHFNYFGVYFDECTKWSAIAYTQCHTLTHAYNTHCCICVVYVCVQGGEGANVFYYSLSGAQLMCRTTDWRMNAH